MKRNGRIFVRSWQVSGSVRANKHYQSGNQKIQFKKNPFSEYTNRWDIFPEGYYPSNVASNPMYFTAGTTVAKGPWGVWGGLRTGSIMSFDTRCLKKAGKYGKIHIGIKKPPGVGKIYLMFRRPPFQRIGYLNKDLSSIEYVYFINFNTGEYIPSGGNKFFEYKIAASTFKQDGYTMADLEQGIDIYIMFSDMTLSQWVTYPCQSTYGNGVSGLYLYAETPLTAEQISTFSTEGNRDFLLTAESTAISEEEYENAG